MSGDVCDLDSRQQHRQLEILDRERLAQNILPRQIVAALLENMNHRCGGNESVDRDRLVNVRRAQVFCRESRPFLEAEIVLPARVRRILEVSGGDQSLRLLETRGLQRSFDRSRAEKQIAFRRPADVIDFADGLRGGLVGCRDNERINAGALQRDDLRNRP